MEILFIEKYDKDEKKETGMVQRKKKKNKEIYRRAPTVELIHRRINRKKERESRMFVVKDGEISNIGFIETYGDTTNKDNNIKFDFKKIIRGISTPVVRRVVESG